MNAQLGHFTVIFPSRLFSFIINDVFFFCCFSEGEASSFFPLALCVYFDDARRTFFSSSSFLFSFEDDFGVSGSGTWLLWSLRSSSKLFFYSNLPPSASILEGYFMSNAQLTRLRTQWLSIVIFFFSSSFSSRICSLEKTRFSKSFDALGPFLKCGTRRFCAFSFLNCLLMMLRRLSAPLRWRSCVSLLLLLFHWVAGELDEFLIAVHTL